MDEFESKIAVTTKGFGFVKNENFEDDLLIESQDIHHAFNGDIVRAKVKKTQDNSLKAEVIEIVKRTKKNFVCTFTKEGTSDICLPDDKKAYFKFELKDSDLNNLSDNTKVFVEFLDWPENQINPSAKILRVIGTKGQHESEMVSIILEKGFETDFPPEVEAEAVLLKNKWDKIPESEVKKRRDFRDEIVFTIDPVDAKDFDDALSFKKLENGNYEIGVHIADVSHYVEPGTKLDKEASERAFSVYLVDRTIPMLPEILSNNLCSLNPNEEKLAFSVVFEIDSKAEVINRWFGKTIIKSKRRFNYEEAQKILDDGVGDLFEELNTLNKLAKIFSVKNTQSGTINFEKDEIKFELDSNGHPIKIFKKSRIDTNKLIEEFMLLANREVAKFIYDCNEKYDSGIGLMYRVHDVPDREKIKQLSVFLKALGYNLPIAKDGSVSAQDINALLNEVTGKVEESLIKTATIRTMSKAIYSTENTGHFGLAFEYYTHFTSPIRRYPDLLVHRILETYLKKEEIKEQDAIYFEEMAQKSTDREIAASDAERDSIKYKQMEYMQDYINKEYKGVISGVSKWGLYVIDQETLSEGMVHISKLGNDFFVLDEKNYAIVGEKTKQKFTLGDEIKVKVESIDLDKRAMDLSLVK